MKVNLSPGQKQMQNGLMAEVEREMSSIVGILCAISGMESAQTKLIK